jgi:proteasome lid subunit RPN8/RPN11
MNPPCPFGDKLTKPICLARSVIDSVLNYSKGTYPDEAILLLTGKNDKDRVTIDGIEVPPLAVHGKSFSEFPLHMLPMDFSFMGTAHSHPSGVLKPSVPDMNNFYGRLMIIAAYPYETMSSLAVFDSRGNVVKYEVLEDKQSQ